MSKLRNHSDPLPMELIKKYRDGTLSAEEEANLNALSASDPFVADALEGSYHLKNGDTFTADVHELRMRLKNKTQSQKGHPNYWWAAAASFVLLGIAFYIVYNFVLPSDSSNIVSKQSSSATVNDSAESNPQHTDLSMLSIHPPQKLADGQQAAKTDLPETLAFVQAPSISQSPAEAETIQNSMYLSTDISQAEVDEISPTVPEVEQESFDENFTLVERSTQKKVALEKSVISYDNSSSFNSTSSPEAIKGWRIVRGKIVDKESGDPLPGVNVIVKDTTIGTVADIEGYFEISYPEQFEQLKFTFIGFNSTVVNISGQDSILVAMVQNGQTLSEVVVTGYATQEKRDVTGSVSTVDMESEENNFSGARPLDGMRSFRKYLEEHQQYPENWQPGDKAVVKLSFYVQPGGQISNIVIEKSAGEWLDQEAIRLLEDGPAWEAASRNGQSIGQEVKLRVRFKK